MNDPAFNELREAFRRLAERQAAAGGAEIIVSPSKVPHTAREVLAVLFGEPHGGHSVASVEKRPNARLVLCSCGTRWLVDEPFCRKRKVEYAIVEAALRNAPVPPKA